MSKCRAFSFLFTFVANLAFINCGGGGGSSSPAPLAPVISGFTATPASITQGGNAQLTATFVYGTGTVTPGGLAITSGTPLTVSPAATSTYTLTVSGAGGSVQANVTVTVTPPRIMLFTANWGDNSVRITDDLLNGPNPATPRVLVGATTQIAGPRCDALAVDRTRKMVYVTSYYGGNKLLVWHNVATATGNTAPDRTITFTGVTGMNGVAVDSTNDRLYVCVNAAAGAKIYVVASASSANGAVTPGAILDLAGAWLFLDAANNRLYVAEDGNNVLHVLNGASTLQTGAGPTKTLTFTGLSLRKIFVDAAKDRLYLASRNDSPGGFNVFAFANASGLTGTIADPDGSSAMRIRLSVAMFVLVDGQDHLYCLPDSAGAVLVYNNASTLSGIVGAAPDKTIAAAVSSGYGMDFLAY